MSIASNTSSPYLSMYTVATPGLISYPRPGNAPVCSPYHSTSSATGPQPTPVPASANVIPVDKAAKYGARIGALWGMAYMSIMFLLKKIKLPSISNIGKAEKIGIFIGNTLFGLSIAAGISSLEGYLTGTLLAKHLNKAQQK